MLKVKIPVFGVCAGLLCFSLILMVPACGSAPASSGNSASQAQSAANAQANAMDALNRMDNAIAGGGGGGRSNAPAAQQPRQQQPQNAPSAQVTVTSGGAKPAWVDSVDSVYNRSQFVAAVGNASDRAMAERTALGNLVAIFGQSIQADQTIANTYQEAVRNGVTAGWTDNISMQNTISTSASMDTLVGAEIRAVWQDTRNNVFYAVAVMEKARTAQLYTDMILANQAMIKNLITMNATERNSIEGLSRYKFAAAIADINTTYMNLLSAIGASQPAGHVNGETYRLEAVNITRTIPIGVTVRNDKSGRIQGAFAKSLSDLGFRSGGNNSRYMLDVTVNVSPVELANNPNKFARIEVTANLTDTSTRQILMPYNFNNREGHTSLSEAENRAYARAETRINQEYTNALSTFLAQLLPKK